MHQAPRHAAVVGALAGLAALSPAAAQPVRPAPLDSGQVTFLIHATIVGAIRGWARVAQASFTGDQLGAVRGSVVVRVADMQTGNGTRDRHLREAMRADSFPEIRFDLDAVEPDSAGADAAAATLEGRLTICGITRPVRARASVALTSAGTVVAATFPLDMRDYGIRPPVRALVLRVAPDVVVAVRLAFAAPSSP